MSRDNGFVIESVSGAAARAGIEKGDRLLSMNGVAVRDFIDYDYFASLSDLRLEIEDSKGVHNVHIVKDQAHALGITLEKAIYPRERRCANNCIFCFIDQQPHGKRDSLYVKDDDWRYSVMFGNYVTLTNVGDRELERIILRKASPLNVSVHATDPNVRCALLRNNNAGDIMLKLRKLTESGIAVNAQAVLVNGINTGDVLRRSLEEVYSLGENARTFAAVPVGLTQCREGLSAIKPFTAQLARECIDIVEQMAQKSLRERGTRFAYASDELYYIAGLPYPIYEEGGYMAQLGNGVGMYWEMVQGMREAAKQLRGVEHSAAKLISVTGEAAYGIISEVANAAMKEAPWLSIEVIMTYSAELGRSVTVAGLLSGRDFLLAAQGAKADGLLIPADALRDGVFLDDMKVEELADSLGMPVRAVVDDAYDYIEAIFDVLNITEEQK